jgi:hypothetical protein
MERKKIRATVSAQTLYHLKKMADASGSDNGRVIDRLMVFYREHGGDALADEHTRQRSLLGRKTG